MKRRVDTRRRPVAYKVGDQVLLSSKNLTLPSSLTRKFSALYLGPFKVVRVLSEVTIELELPEEYGRMERKFHVDLIKPYYPDEFAVGKRLAPIEVNGELEWIIDAIVGKVEETGKPVKYTVRWKGYPPSETSWKTYADLQQDGVEHFADDYEEALRLKTEAYDSQRKVIRARKHVNYKV